MKFNYYKSIQFILLIFLIASTYIGIPLNGGEKGWIYVNGLLRDFFTMQFEIFQNTSSYWAIFNTSIILIINIALYFCPCMIFTVKFNRTGTIYIPAAYLVLNLIYFPLLIFLFIPYVLIWLVLFFYSKFGDKNEIIE